MVQNSATFIMNWLQWIIMALSLLLTLFAIIGPINSFRAKLKRLQNKDTVEKLKSRKQKEEQLKQKRLDDSNKIREEEHKKRNEIDKQIEEFGFKRDRVYHANIATKALNDLNTATRVEEFTDVEIENERKGKPQKTLPASKAAFLDVVGGENREQNSELTFDSLIELSKPIEAKRGEPRVIKQLFKDKTESNFYSMHNTYSDADNRMMRISLKNLYRWIKTGDVIVDNDDGFLMIGFYKMEDFNREVAETFGTEDRLDSNLKKYSSNTCTDEACSPTGEVLDASKLPDHVREEYEGHVEHEKYLDDNVYVSKKKVKSKNSRKKAFLDRRKGFLDRKAKAEILKEKKQLK